MGWIITYLQVADCRVLERIACCGAGCVRAAAVKTKSSQILNRGEEGRRGGGEEEEKRRGRIVNLRCDSTGWDVERLSGCADRLHSP